MSKCQYCNKGSEVGNAVSHAKNRTKRWFKPNIQKLKVLLNGQSTRLALCTKCIKRLHKDGKLGRFYIKKYTPSQAVVSPKTKEKKTAVQVGKKEEKLEKILKTPEKQEKPKPAMSIEDIVGKKA